MASQPPAFQKFAERRKGWRTPPAIFPPVMGLFGLGLAWRRAMAATGLPGGLAEALLGAVSLLYLFCLAAYLGKVVQRPGVLAEDFRTLPGRAGFAAANLSGVLLAATLVPYAPGLALGVLGLALVAHAALGVWVLNAYVRGPEETRVITPVWHLTFVGYILAPLSLVPLGQVQAATMILFATMAVAGLIYAVSAVQLVRRIPPAPLRPLLAIHLAPVSLFATVATLVDLTGLAAVFGVALLGVLAALLAAGRWIAEAGFSALWGAFTFPSAAAAGALLALGWDVAGLLAVAAASAIVFPIAVKVMQAWAKGGLAVRTNAAQA
ncbi:MAG: tellurium resistance protein [Gemmobacter sp.]|uniref:SLAC1 family transporter n=1 Tax=Gemmobacter sp. TaxID=1898957 RepID=UPI003919AACD